MESKEINKSESTLTQGTMSKTAFPSNKIFLLSFSFPRDLLHEVFRCTFCAYLFFCFSCLDFFAFKSFFTGVFWFLPYAYQFLLLEIHIPVHWTIQKKTIRNSFAEITSEKFVQTSVVYFYPCWKNFVVWKKFTDFNLWAKFVMIIYYLFTLSLFCKGMTQKMSPCLKKLFL